MTAFGDLAIHCRGVQKSYGAGPAKVSALNGVDLDVAQGEILMLAGPSGCGKTTFLSVVATLLEADSGCCEVFGKDVSAMKRTDKAVYRRDAMGFVFQAFNLLPGLTALENVAVPLLVSGMKRRPALVQAREALESVGLDRVDALPAQMSGGQQQRVAIARAIVGKPRLMVCDEPTSSLDHDNGQLVVGLIKDMARAVGCAVLLVTHDNRIYHFADRIVCMEDGKIVDKDYVVGANP